MTKIICESNVIRSERLTRITTFFSSVVDGWSLLAKSRFVLTVDPPYASEPSVVRSFSGIHEANKSVNPAYIVPSPRPLNTRNIIKPVDSAASSAPTTYENEKQNHLWKNQCDENDMDCHACVCVCAMNIQSFFLLSLDVLFYVIGYQIVQHTVLTANKWPKIKCQA